MAIRTIDVRERVMAKNDELAASVRLRLKTAGVTTFNLVSSPGSGKTLLLEKTLAALGKEIRMAVITGDSTQIDLPAGKISGLGEARAVVSKVEGIEFVHFSEKDVVRHPLVQRIIAAYEAHRETRE